MPGLVKEKLEAFRSALRNVINLVRTSQHFASSDMEFEKTFARLNITCRTDATGSEGSEGSEGDRVQVVKLRRVHASYLPPSMFPPIGWS
jgi:hypothetical protein